jgi:hypothetical protein
MLIQSVSKINETDVENYAWRRLGQFQNIEFTAQLICRLHKLEKKHLPNAKKQAEQIKFCLTQAREYFEASKLVTLATKPVQQYYCIMSLALAEVLLKQTADSRLSALRASHNCHGLAFSLTADPSTNDSLADALVKMHAKPQLGSRGLPKGTFEVWRRSAREYPLGGYFTEMHGEASTTGFRVIFGPEDTPPPPLENKGVNLHQCLTNLPYMADAMARWGVQLRMVKAKVSRSWTPASNKSSTRIIIHPSSAELLNAFGNLCKLSPNQVNAFRITELPSGYILEMEDSNDYMCLPHSTCINSEDTYFTCSTENLGEFGYLYISLHILGNYARYYPDQWMKHIEAYSPLASVVDDLCLNAITRLPLLSLSELSRVYHVIEK